MKEQEVGGTPQGGNGAPAPLRPYRKPRLTEFGSIAKLTQGTRTNQKDGAGGGFKMAGCL